ncbi:MAG: hypothetical protein RBR24_03925 [Candidatus Carbobacillus sp.]|nr:hypothetical protein [Candidatus Carbobacillus sp.]
MSPKRSKEDQWLALLGTTFALSGSLTGLIVAWGSLQLALRQLKKKQSKKTGSKRVYSRTDRKKSNRR